jgi:hypothetical protein
MAQSDLNLPPFHRKAVLYQILAWYYFQFRAFHADPMPASLLKAGSSPTQWSPSSVPGNAQARNPDCRRRPLQPINLVTAETRRKLAADGSLVRVLHLPVAPQAAEEWYVQ